MFQWKSILLFGLICCLGFCSCLDEGDEDRYLFDVGIYSGAGSWEESINALEAAVQAMEYTAERFSDEFLFNHDLRRYRMIILPAGDPRTYSTNMGHIGRKFIRDYVELGGALAAFGSGASVTDSDEGQWPGIGLLEGDASWPVNQIAPLHQWILTDISTADRHHDLTFGGFDSYTTLYRWGPEFIVNDPSGVDVIYRYDMTGSPAMISIFKGLGTVVLCGFNPEFEENSPVDNSSFGSELHDPESEWDIIERILQYCILEY